MSRNSNHFKTTSFNSSTHFVNNKTRVSLRTEDTLNKLVSIRELRSIRRPLIDKNFIPLKIINSSRRLSASSKKRPLDLAFSSTSENRNLPRSHRNIQSEVPPILPKLHSSIRYSSINRFSLETSNQEELNLLTVSNFSSNYGLALNYQQTSDCLTPSPTNTRLSTKHKTLQLAPFSSFRSKAPNELIKFATDAELVSVNSCKSSERSDSDDLIKLPIKFAKEELELIEELDERQMSTNEVRASSCSTPNRTDPNWNKKALFLGKVWSDETNEQLLKYQGHDDEIYNLCSSRIDQLVADILTEDNLNDFILNSKKDKLTVGRYDKFTDKFIHMLKDVADVSSKHFALGGLLKEVNDRRLLMLQRTRVEISKHAYRELRNKTKKTKSTKAEFKGKLNIMMATKLKGKLKINQEPIVPKIKSYFRFNYIRDVLSSHLLNKYFLNSNQFDEITFSPGKKKRILNKMTALSLASAFLTSKESAISGDFGDLNSAFYNQQCNTKEIPYDDSNSSMSESEELEIKIKGNKFKRDSFSPDKFSRIICSKKNERQSNSSRRLCFGTHKVESFSSLAFMLKNLSRCVKFKRNKSRPKIKKTVDTGVNLRDLPRKMTKETTILKTVQLTQLKLKESTSDFFTLKLLVENNEVSKFKKTVDKIKFMLNKQNDTGETLLHVAIRAANIEIVDFLLNRNVEVNIRNVKT